MNVIPFGGFSVGNVLDFYDDLDGSYYNVLEQEYHIPDSLNRDSFEQGPNAKKEAGLFACQDLKAYPVDTPDNLLMSRLYFEKTASKLSDRQRFEALEKMEKMASFYGIDISIEPKEQKTASSYEYNPNDFGLAIPLVNVSSGNFLEKYASITYGSHLLMYPLRAQEEIHLANEHFPQGLNEDLEVFRPKVARAIAEKVDPSSLSDVIKEYLPIPKSAAIDDINARARLVPEFSGQYASLLPELDKASPDNPDQLLKIASALENHDINSGLYGNYFENNLMPPVDLMKGIKDDIGSEYNIVNMQGHNLPVKDLEKVAHLVPGFSKAASAAETQVLINSLPSGLKERLLEEIWKR